LLPICPDFETLILQLRISLGRNSNSKVLIKNRQINKSRLRKRNVIPEPVLIKIIEISVTSINPFKNGLLESAIHHAQIS
jgi:hypothetical protein